MVYGNDLLFVEHLSWYSNFKAIFIYLSIYKYINKQKQNNDQIQMLTRD